MTSPALPEFRPPDPPASSAGYRVDLDLMSGELEVTAVRLSPAQELDLVLGPAIGSRLSW